MEALRNKKVLAVLILVWIVFSVAFGLNASSTDYQKFDVLSNNSELVNAECRCYGSLSVRESYPPQYDCEGYEMCTSVNYTRPRN